MCILSYYHIIMCILIIMYYYVNVGISDNSHIYI